MYSDFFSNLVITKLSKCKQSVVKFWNFFARLEILGFFSRVFYGLIGELVDLEAGFKLNSRSICTDFT